MIRRTDLAIEENAKNNIAGVEQNKRKFGDITLNMISVNTKEASEKMQKTIGRYFSLQIPSLNITGGTLDNVTTAICGALNTLLPHTDGTVLIAGLGNTEITADALGPKTALGIFATRHIEKNLAKQIGLPYLRSVAVISPGVLGQTGIETGEILLGIIDRVKPKALIVIDALAANDISHIGTVIQITDTGISPGSGVRNSRKEISRLTMGIPVIAVGIPTVADTVSVFGNTSLENLTETVITFRDTDLMIDRASELLSFSINRYLQPQIDAETLRALT